MEDLRTALERYLADAKKRNPRFSLRAFARQHGLNATSLSLYVRGRRGLSATSKRILTDFLRVDGPQNAHAAWAEPLVHIHPTSADAAELSKNWFHFAVLSLLELHPSENKPRFLARRLGVPTTKVTASLRLLARLNLASKSPTGTWQPSGKQYAVGTVGLSALLNERKLAEFRQNEVMIDYLAKHSIAGKSDYSSVIFTTNPTQIAQAKVLMKNFRRRLIKVLSQGEKTEVYTLQTHLLPITLLKAHEGPKA